MSTLHDEAGAASACDLSGWERWFYGGAAPDDAGAPGHPLHEAGQAGAVNASAAAAPPARTSPRVHRPWPHCALCRQPIATTPAPAWASATGARGGSRGLSAASDSRSGRAPIGPARTGP